MGIPTAPTGLPWLASMDLNPITQHIWLPQFLDQSSRLCVITEKEEWINSDRKDSVLVRSMKGGVFAPAFRKGSWVVDPSWV